MLSILLLLGLCNTADAKDRPTVALVGVHDGALDTAEQERIAKGLASALEADRRVDPVLPGDLARALAGREPSILRDAASGPARRLLEDGRILHDQAQPEEAIPVLEQAIGDLEQAMDITDTSRDLWEARLYLGSSYLSTGLAAEARETWVAAIVTNPERQPDPARLPPSVVQSYREAQAGVVDQVGTVELAAPGARAITLDGREVGADKARVPDVLAGIHHSRATGPGAMVAHQRIEVRDGETAQAPLELKAAPLSLPATTDFARVQRTTDLYRTLGLHTKTDLVLVAGVHNGEGMIQVYSPSAERFSEPVRFAYTDTPATALIAALPNALDRLDESGSLSRDASSSSSGPLDPSSNRLLAHMLHDPKVPLPAPARSKNTWLYAAGGAAAALLVAGGVTAAALSSGGDKGTIIVGPIP